MGGVQHGQAFVVARAIGETKQRRTAWVDRLQQFIRAQYLGLERISRLFGQLSMRHAVVGQRVACFKQLAADFGFGYEFGLAVRTHNAQVTSHLEEDGRRAV